MCPNNTRGHKRKFSMIKAAHAKLGHDKEKTKRFKIFELLIKTIEGIMLNQTKKKKTKRKSLNPTLGGKTSHFGKKFKRKRSRNKHK